MLRRRYLFLELLRDNDGQVYAYMYDLKDHKCLSFTFWQWLENLEDIQKIGYQDDGEFCWDCPYYEGDDDE